MFYSKVCEDTYQMSDNLPNDRLFEGIWPTPNGVSVNAYLIEGADKYALIDGSTSWTGGLKKFKSDDGVEWDSLIESICEVDNSFEELKEVFKANNLDEKKIGYVIINHMEPDHSSWIESMYKINPDIEVYISERGSHILESFYSFKEKVNVVKDGDKLDIGNGHVLTFYEIPNVHWPDTMVTFDEKTGVVFACDAFGSYGAVDENNYDDLLSEEKIRFYEDEAIGYYSNIVASFSTFVQRALAKLGGLPVKIIAPGHGIVWRKNPERVIKLYEELASYQAGPAKEEITLIWGSMYGMTERAVKTAIETLEETGIKYHVHNVPETEIGEILKSCWTSTGVILAMPTYEYNMFPPMANVLDELGKKKVQNRKAFRFGSFGWSGGAEKELKEITERRKMNWEFLPSVEFKGIPTDGEKEAVRERILDLVAAVRADVRDK